MYRFGLLQRNEEPLFWRVVRFFAVMFIIISVMELIFEGYGVFRLFSSAQAKWPNWSLALVGALVGIGILLLDQLGQVLEEVRSLNGWVSQILKDAGDKDATVSLSSIKKLRRHLGVAEELDDKEEGP